MKKVLILALFMFGCGKKAGKNGIDGPSGASCSVSAVSGGAAVSCTDGTSAFLSNGADGLNGIDGINGTNGLNGVNGVNGVDSLQEVLNPCGVNGAYEEVLLKFAGGIIIAVFDGGPHGDRLALLTPGNYTTTDGFSCSFTVNPDMTLSY